MTHSQIFLLSFSRRLIAGIFFGAFLLLVLPAVTHASGHDHRYWVLGTGNWNDTARWSTTTGGAGGASVPVAGQTAHFDNKSGGGNVTLNTAVDVAGLHLSPSYTGSILQVSSKITVGTGHLLMGSGRLIGGASTFSLSGSYTQTGGIARFQQTFAISGSLTVTYPGSAQSITSFTTTGATIFEGKVDQNLIKGANGATLRFGAVTINNRGSGTSDDIIVNSSGALTMSGHLTVSLGNLDLNTRNVALAVGSGITLADNAQATLITDANITASGHIVAHGAGVFTLSGSMTLTMDGRDQNLDTNDKGIPNLVIASASGTTIQHNEVVSSTLTVNAGSTLSLGVYALSATSSTITNLGTITENTGKIHHTATNVLLTDSSYAEDNTFSFGDRVYITLTDSDENIDGTTADTVSVTIIGPDTETVTLVETTVSSGIFRGSIPTAYKDQNINAQNGVLEAGGSSTITLTFVDAQDLLENADTATLAAAAVAASAATTTTATSSGGGGGGGGSRRGAVLSSQGVAKRQTAGDVIGSESEESEKEEEETVAPSEEETTSSPWSDLDLDHPHADATLRLYKAGIVKGNGDGTVQLDRSLSRVEALTLLVRTLGEEESPEGSLPFSDIDPRAWYAGPLKTAFDLAIIKGFPDGTFRPGESLNLVQSLKIISIALGFADQSDESNAANWFDPYVTVGREAGLIHGSIVPGRTVTRGEFFEWLALLLP